jgi:hypothetical protein
MTREENIRAILECNFSGFKDEKIDVAVNAILNLKAEPCERDETEVITNQEWLSLISPENWVRVIHWLYHDYGTRFTDSEGAILKWLRQDMREEQT